MATITLSLCYFFKKVTGFVKAIYNILHVIRECKINGQRKFVDGKINDVS